jgi:RNA polymerase sigma-70 factor (ECF subfamily)
MAVTARAEGAAGDPGSALPQQPARRAAAARGDDDTFADAVRRSLPRLRAVARRWLHDRDDVDDVVQEALLAATRALPRFQHRAALGTWLHRIVVNAARMHLRRGRCRPEHTFTDLDPAASANGDTSTALPAPDAACPAEAAETRAAVHRAIAELSREHRNVLHARDICGLDTAAAAELFGVTPNAVKIRLHRARLALRQELASHHERKLARPAASALSVHDARLPHARRPAPQGQRAA